MKELPSYFFLLNKKKKKKINNCVTFDEYDKNLFSVFMETDGAYINDSNNIVTPNLKNNFHPFLIHNTFIVTKNYKKYELNSTNENLNIEPKTIVINESKLSIPQDISNFTLNNKYDKNLLSKTLIFTLNKLIKKIHYYYELVQNEILIKDEITKYKFLLCLIYNNLPINNIDEIIENDLKILIDNGYIKNEFKLKIIYLIPNLGSYNLHVIKKEIKDLEKKNKDMEIKYENKIEDLKKNMEDLEIKNKKNLEDLQIKNQNIINELKSEFKMQENRMKLELNVMSVQLKQLLKENKK